VVQRELALINRPAGAQQDRFALIVPFRFGNSIDHALVAVIEITGGSADAEHQSAAAACLRDIQSAGTLAATQPYRILADGPDWPSYRSALESAQRPGQARPALVFLASETGATVCEDAALDADDLTVGALAERVLKKVNEPPGIQNKEALGWALDSAAYELLVDLQSSNRISPGLAEILTLHAGEAGRHAGSVDEALKAATNPQDFDVRLTAENYIFLEDSSPASRVRAFDWLRAHDRAPAGFHPLDDEKARRAALDKAQNPSNQPTSGGAP
jgi:hypothetical protein